MPNNDNLNPLDFRQGAAFREPVPSDHPFYNRHAPGWGLLVSPDEMRYVVLFGNELTSSSSSQTITDTVLFYYEQNAIAMVEQVLDINILPRVVLTDDRLEFVTGEPIPRIGKNESGEFVFSDDVHSELQDFISSLESEEQEAQLIIRETGYPYRKQYSDQYLYTLLNQRPLQRCYRAVMVDPRLVTLFDIYQFRIEKKGYRSVVQFFPNNLGSTNFLPVYEQRIYQFRYPYPDFPNAIQIDYKVGYDKAAVVPYELRELVRKLAGIMLMADYGDGKTSALASSSANLNSISESFTTTLSATSAAFGARIKQWQDEVKEWMKVHAQKYSRAVVGAL